ncbi:unnamed protein product [Calypogeia fissa]
MATTAASPGVFSATMLSLPSLAKRISLITGSLRICEILSSGCYLFVRVLFDFMQSGIPLGDGWQSWRA